MTSPTDRHQPEAPIRGQKTGWRYSAFISHSWADDTELAQSLHRDLQRLGKPIFSRRARSVFLDTSELAADPSLWGKLRSVLDNSERLIFLASPAAAKPDAYIAQEIDYWITSKGTSHVLVALVDGAIEWNRDTACFDREATTALPECLLDSLEGPLYVDLTEYQGRNDLSLEIPEWKGKVAELAAPLEGPDVTKSDLIDEDLTIQRKRRRLRNGAITALVALALATTIASVVALRNADEAREQRDTAEQRRQEAVARQLSAQSLASLDSFLDGSLLLATEAAATAPLGVTRDALLHGVYGRPELVAYFRGHETIILASAFDPDGDAVNTVSVDGWVHQWDMRAGRGKRIARVSPTARATFSADGTTMATEVGERTVSVVSTGLWQELAAPREGPPGNVTAIALAEHGDLLAIGSSVGQAFIHALAEADMTPLQFELHDGAVRAIAFQPGGSLVASAGDDGKVVVANLRTGEVVRVLEPASFKLKAAQPLYAVAFSDDGAQIAAGGFDELLIVWDATSGEELAAPRQGHNGTITAIDFDSTGTAVATAGYDETVIVWDLLTGQQTVLKGHSEVVWDVSFSRDNQMLISAGADRAAILWQLVGSRTGAESVPVGETVVSWVDEDTLLTIDDRIPLLYDISTGEILSTMDRISSVATAMDVDATAGLAVTGDLAGVVSVHDMTTGNLISSKLLHQMVTGVAVSRDGTLAATVGFEGMVRVLRLPDLAELWHVDEARTLDGVVFDHAGTRFATLGSGGVRIYEPDTGDVVNQIPVAVSVTGAAFSPDDSRIVLAGSNSEIEVRATQTSELLLDPLTGHTDIVTAIALDPHSSLLASASYDNSVRIWDATTGQAIGPPLLAHMDYVTDIEISPEGRTIASAGLDGIYLWRFDREALSATACAIAGRVLTRTEWTVFNDSTEPYHPYCTQDLVTKPNPRLGGRILFDGSAERAAFDVWYDSHNMDSLIDDMDAMLNTLVDAAAGLVLDDDMSGMIVACQNALESRATDRFDDAIAETPDEVLLDAGLRFAAGLSRALDLCVERRPEFTSVLLEAVPAAAEYGARMKELILGERGIRDVSRDSP